MFRLEVQLTAGKNTMKPQTIALAMNIAIAPMAAQAGDQLKLETFKGEGKPRNGACIAGAPTPSLCVRLSEKSARDWENWTTKHVHEIADMKLNGKVVARPRILGPITGGIIPIAFKSQAEADAAKIAIAGEAGTEHATIAGLVRRGHFASLPNHLKTDCAD